MGFFSNRKKKKEKIEEEKIAVIGATLEANSSAISEEVIAAISVVASEFDTKFEVPEFTPIIRPEEVPAWRRVNFGKR